MKKKPLRSPLAATPRYTPPRQPPFEPRVSSPPPHEPIRQAPPIQGTRAPRQRAVARVPNPRRPAVVRNTDGGDLLDLFAFFPDLPGPPRPTSRPRARSIWQRFRR